MNLLPRSHKEFGSANYWEDFFKKRGKKSFEWYGEYCELCGILHKYVKPRDDILVIGCGSSNLSADLYDVGHHNITNIDISDIAIKQMIDKNKNQRPDMKFIKMDMLQTDFDDGKFSVVLDKGTLDAVMTDEKPDTIHTVDKMFAEVDRVLRLGGRYICISLSQDHIIQKVTTYFSERGWPIRICRVEDSDNDEPKEFHMPVFAFIFTKFKKIPNMKQILEISYFNETVERFEDTDSLIGAIKELQHYGVVRQQLNQKMNADEHISLDLYGELQNSPRYTLHVVDANTRTGNKFAIFIVPEGRETEWYFNSVEGRSQLAESAGFERLVVVTLHRNHEYKDIDAIKAELSSKVMELAPPKLGEKQVPFLSVGEHIKQRQIQYKGQSDFSGEFYVEDVVVDDSLYRRLVFLTNRNAVQSSALLVKSLVTSKKKGKNKKFKYVIEHSALCCEHHVIILAGLAMLENFSTTIDENLKIAVVGLGGGGLVTFLHKHFMKMHIDAVELDDQIVDVAKKWFEFEPDGRLRLHIGDGYIYLEQLAAKGEACYHSIIIDVDNKDLSDGLSAPPENFVEKDFLALLGSLLLPNGMLIVNLSCRNKTLRDTIISDIKSAFKSVFYKQVPEEVNQIIFALPSSRKTDLFLEGDGGIPEALRDNLRTLHRIAKRQNPKSEEIPALAYKLTNMKLL